MFNKFWEFLAIFGTLILGSILKIGAQKGSLKYFTILL